jgi:hypothetical protein
MNPRAGRVTSARPGWHATCCLILWIIGEGTNRGGSARQTRRTDGEWFYIISHGHDDMPAEKRLADRQKWEMILYLRTFAKPPRRVELDPMDPSRGA